MSNERKAVAKLSSLPTIIELNTALRELKRKHDVAVDCGSNGVGVTIQGQYQDDEFVLACRHSILNELERRIRKIEDQLRELGIWID